MKTIYEKSLGLTPLIQIEQAGGNLQIKGWMRSEIFINSDDEAVELVEKDDGLLLRTHTDCLIRLPRGARLEIGRIAGNVRLKYLDADLKIEQIGGSLVCRSIGNLFLSAVQGNVMVKDVLGSISAQQIGGSLIARRVQGEMSLGQVGGNLDARNLCASLTATVGGFSRVEWNVFNGGSVMLKTGGSIHCEISDALQPQLNLISGAHDIHLIQLGKKEHHREGIYQTTIGEGIIPFELQAGGKIIFIIRPPLIEEDEDLDAIFNEEVNQISEKVRRQFQTQMEAFQQRMDRFAEKMDELGAEGQSSASPSSRQRPFSANLDARLQEKMRRAQEKMEQKLAEAQRRSEVKAKPSLMEKLGFGRKRGQASETASAVATDEERLFILKMLEQKKITVAEAEKLLAALEGNT